MDDGRANQQTPATAASKRVQVLPPPIDTTQPRRSLPQGLVRTPYPEHPNGLRHKDLSHITSSVPNTPAPAPHADSILTLSIRPSKPHNRRRVTTIIIPAPNTTTLATSKQKEQADHFQPHLYQKYDHEEPFDDATFFLHLRKSYTSLAGPFRFFSARRLKRIVISGRASKVADTSYGWLAQPRSPRELAFKGLQDTFGEDKIWAHFRRPGMGRGRYAFVHWARRLAEAEGRGDVDDGGFEAGERRIIGLGPDVGLVRKLEQPEGLEFVMGWSVGRILGVLALVLVASVASVLLWVLLGPMAGGNLVPSGSGEDGAPSTVGTAGGFRGAGERVGGGVAMGVCVLLVGLSSMAGWMGVSWLAI